MAREMAQWLGCLLVIVRTRVQLCSTYTNAGCDRASGILGLKEMNWILRARWPDRLVGHQAPDSVGPCLRKLKENKVTWDIGALLVLTSTQAPTGELYIHAHMHAYTHMYKHIYLFKKRD